MDERNMSGLYIKALGNIVQSLTMKCLRGPGAICAYKANQGILILSEIVSHDKHGDTFSSSVNTVYCVKEHNFKYTFFQNNFEIMHLRILLQTINVINMQVLLSIIINQMQI